MIYVVVFILVCLAAWLGYEVGNAPRDPFDKK
jgi:hypothetical protein